MIFEKESFAINGAMFEVHRQLGPGLAEKVYQEALEIELKLRNIPFEREKVFKIEYKNNVLNQHYVADFVCYDKIIVELKAVDVISDIHRAQLINYLKITGLKLGLLQNFNMVNMQPAERLLNTY
ncbi:MAG: GxxExxY protein [Prevotella sp.]|nr:GxxExxY protein [Prevotella sp.]MBQ5971948.1 GxxExxY protein [Prevotella sp.]MBQ6161620.1 GxxExxY protein [Prevotella sp.]MBQ6187251.1 GxxExxY protein [Prevotella sp.]